MASFSTRVRVGAVAIAGTMAGHHLSPATAAAHAYPEAVWDCDASELSWRLDIQPIDGLPPGTWDQPGIEPLAKDWAREAIEAWGGILDHDGQPLVELEYDEYSSFSVFLVPLPASVNGRAFCNVLGTRSILINEALHDDKAEIQRVAQHEMGHHLGMEHSGQADSIVDTRIPTMATCLTPGSAPSGIVPSHDDQSYLHYLHSRLPRRQHFANWHFEDSPAGWAIWGDVEAQLLPGEGVGGGNAVALRHGGPGYSDFMFQTVHLATGPDQEQRVPAFSYRTPDDGWEGGGFFSSAMMTTYHQQLDYFPLPGEDCDYAENMDGLNGVSYVGGLIANAGISASFHSPEWMHVGSTFWDHPSPPHVPWSWPVADGYKMQIRISGDRYVVATGERSWVLVDNVRLEGT